MKKFWKNTNAKWLIILLFLSGIYVLCTVYCNKSILAKHATEIVNEFVNATFSSIILLLILEIIVFRRDKELGYLDGQYVRKYITQINEDGQRSKNIDLSKRSDEEYRSNIKFLEDYKYHELTFYACDTTEWVITLNYDFAGNYTGIAEYYLHDTKSPYDFPKPKTNVEINFSLNSADKITGTGSYQYQTAQDYGIYKFQVIDKTKKRILVYYKNVLPSGLAEGYEIWEKK